ncbi:hypothetical protein LJC17_01665 [Acholeplasma sp. OttesenSCG-928-E16]|nr:hypothetical protein [Acholeplasma sp. OttesenSCG-928-E16]
MVNFKEKLTLEKEQIAYNILKKRTKKTKIVWAIIYGVLLIAFLVLALVLGALEGPLVYIILCLMLVLVVYLNFFHDMVKFKLNQKKLVKFQEENSDEELAAQIDFNSEHLAIDSPLRAKKGVIRVDYEKIGQVYFDDDNKLLFFLLKGDSDDYYALFLDDKEKSKIKEACEMFPNEIINQDLLEAYLGQKIERVFAEEYYQPDNNEDKEVLESQDENNDSKDSDN